jgi:hypothetical protein
VTFSLTSPVTGAAIAAFTAPTYTVVADQVPSNVAGKAFVVTAIGGTQAGVDTAGSASKPWTALFSRPPNLKILTAVDANNQLRSVPVNEYQFITRKGVLPLAGQPARTMTIRTTFGAVAGADTADPANVKAGVSFHVGCLSQQSTGIADSLLTGAV